MIVALVMKNLGTSRADYNALNFRLQDGIGVVRNPNLMAGLDTDVSYGQLPPGGSVAGTLVYEVRSGDRDLTMIWEPCAFLCPAQQISIKETFR